MKTISVLTRIDQAAQLGESPNTTNYYVLLSKYLTDKNELVRVEALESLRNYQDFIKKSDIAFLLVDSSPLVRSLAVELYSFFPDAKKDIEAIANNQHSMYVKLGCQLALYNMGEEENALKNIVYILANSKQYRIRIRAAHILLQIVSSSNKDQVLDSLRIALIKEKQMLKKSTPYASQAAVFTLEKAIKELT